MIAILFVVHKCISKTYTKTWVGQQAIIFWIFEPQLNERLSKLLKNAFELIEQGAVKAEKLVTHRFPIEKTAEAFRLTAEAKDSLKSLIVFE